MHHKALLKVEDFSREIFYYLLNKNPVLPYVQAEIGAPRRISDEVQYDLELSLRSNYLDTGIGASESLTFPNGERPNNDTIIYSLTQLGDSLRKGDITIGSFIDKPRNRLVLDLGSLILRDQKLPRPNRPVSVKRGMELFAQMRERLGML